MEDEFGRVKDWRKTAPPWLQAIYAESERYEQRRAFPMTGQVCRCRRCGTYYTDAVSAAECCTLDIAYRDTDGKQW
jgi:hypothetical protein